MGARAFRVDARLLREVLKLAAYGPLTLSQLAEKLGVGVGEAEALIGALLAHSYLREVEPMDCAACPLRGVCAVNVTRGVRVFELTEKGRRVIERGASL
ncbi:MAG: hypothetical protein QXJ38_03705 [Thermofilaceae archaeon]